MISNQIYEHNECNDYLDILVLTLSSFTLYWSFIISLLSHRCPPSPLLGGSCVCERWEEVCCAVPVGGSAVSVQQRVHPGPRGAMGLQVVLSGPHAGFVQLPRQHEWRPGRRWANGWNQRSRWRVRDGDDSELPWLLWQQPDGPNCGLHVWFLNHTVRVLQEQRHLHHQQ